MIAFAVSKPAPRPICASQRCHASEGCTFASTTVRSPRFGIGHPFCLTDLRRVERRSPNDEAFRRVAASASATSKSDMWNADDACLAVILLQEIDAAVCDSQDILSLGYLLEPLVCTVLTCFNVCTGLLFATTLYGRVPVGRSSVSEVDGRRQLFGGGAILISKFSESTGSLVSNVAYSGVHT